MNRIQRLQAMRAGDHAGRSGLPATTCPYQMDTPDGRALASAWMRSWLQANPAALQPDTADN